MTIETAAETADAQLVGTTAAPGHPGRWRVVSFLFVLATAIIVLISIVQARVYDDAPVPASGEDASPPITIDATVDLSLTDGATIGASALSEQARGALTDQGPQIMVPASGAALVSVYDASGALNGLGIAIAQQNGVQISADSTARTLMTLAPAVLEPDINRAMTTVDGFTQDAAFDELVEALTEAPNLSAPNELVETRLARILDRIPVPVAPPDQGCDSIADTRAYPASGACVRPSADKVTISNEQDRWLLVYSPDADWAEICAAVAPAGHAGSDVDVRNMDCPEGSLLVTPGPSATASTLANNTVIAERKQVATAVTFLAAYLRPFAQLAAGEGGLGPESLADDDIIQISETLGNLGSDASSAIYQAFPNDVSPSTLHRHAVEASLAAFGSDDLDGLVSDSLGTAADARSLLGFYRRVGDHMVNSTEDQRWEADAVSTLIKAGER